MLYLSKQIIIERKVSWNRCNVVLTNFALALQDHPSLFETLPDPTQTVSLAQPVHVGAKTTGIAYSKNLLSFHVVITRLLNSRPILFECAGGEMVSQIWLVCCYCCYYPDFPFSSRYQVEQTAVVIADDGRSLTLKISYNGGHQSAGQWSLGKAYTNKMLTDLFIYSPDRVFRDDLWKEPLAWLI